MTRDVARFVCVGTWESCRLCRGTGVVVEVRTGEPDVTHFCRWCRGTGAVNLKVAIEERGK